MKRMMWASLLASALAYAFCADPARADHALDAADGSPTNAVYVDNEGEVGIGTTVPAYLLDVAGPVNLNKGKTGIALRVNGAEALWYDGTTFSWGYGGAANYFADNVGVGVGNPAEKLHVSGRARFDLGGGSINVSTPGGNPGLITFAPNGHRRDIVCDNYGMRLMVSDSSSRPSAIGIDIFEDGTTSVKALHITGGADVAEPFAVSGTRPPAKGAVMVIDDQHPGQLRISDRAYDRCVAGVVCGAGGLSPGLTLSQPGVIDKGTPVALTGRVYALADATNGSIKPGDLLTTSNTAGHAMKVTDCQRAQGAILGKAMSTLESGRGLVLVLVTLQ